MMEDLPEEDKLEMSFIQDYFTNFFLKVTTKSAFLPVFSFKFDSNLPQIFLDEIWGKFEWKPRHKSASFEILQFEVRLNHIWVKT